MKLYIDVENHLMYRYRIKRFVIDINLNGVTERMLSALVFKLAKGKEILNLVKAFLPSTYRQTCQRLSSNTN